MGVTIKEAQLVEELKGSDKLPISDGSNIPKSVSVEQIKIFANNGVKTPTKVSELENDSEFTTKKELEEAISSIPIPDVSGQISEALVDYVKKVEGKGLSTNDFTNELKEKLEGITPYDPSELEAEISKLETSLNTLVSGNASNAIESFNEIIAFLNNVSDKETLSGIIAGINTRIAEVEGKIPTKVSELTNDNGYLTEHQDISHLATKNELKSKQDVISDLANIREGSAKGATAIQEEQYKGTIAAVNTDESVDDPNIPSGSYDDTEIKKQIAGLASEVERKQENLVSGQNIKTINGKSLLGEGNIEIEIGNSYDDTELKNQIANLETEVSKKADEAETASKLSELGLKVEMLDIQNESEQIVSKQQIDQNKVFGSGIKYAINQDGILLQASKEAGVGKEGGDYYFVNFLLDDGIYWKKNHHYYCAIDTNGVYSDSENIYLSATPKFDNSHMVGTDTKKVAPNKGKRGLYKALIDINRDKIDLYTDSRRLFVQFWNKIYPSQEFEVKIYNIIIVDLGSPDSADYIEWEEVDKRVEEGSLNEYSVAISRYAKAIKNNNIECWGDSLTAQKYGKYIEGETVYTHGFGGKTSTYIRDKFLSEFNEDRTQVIWVGRNNYIETDVVIDDIRDMVSALTHNNFIVMCPPNGYYGEFGTNGENGTGEMKGGNGHSKFLELERRLSEEYPSNFLNIRKAVIEGWRMGNVRLLSDFTQPSIGSNVTIEVSDANFLTTYNSYDENKFGHDFVAKIRIGINGSYDVYKIVEKVDDTHLTVQLEESNRIAVGSTVGNLIDSGGNNAVKYLRVMQNADYMCWLYDTTLSTFRKDGIHMTEDGLKLVAQIVSRKLASMKLL